jgi:replicative DNA helicase
MAEAKNQISKIPPQNIEAEQSVLGSLMIDRDAVIKIADFLQPADFYKPVHQKIYEAMLELYQRNEPIDILSLPNRLKDKNYLQEIGGVSYLTSLTNMVPTASNVVSYAKIVQQKKLLRDLIGAAYDISELGFQEDKDVDDLLDEAEQKIFSITQKSLINQPFQHIKGDVEKAFERIDFLQKGGKKMRGVNTGFIELNKKLSGMQNSDLIILAARPSLGKTSMALTIAFNAAMKDKVPVGIFSLEMSRDQITDRLISMASGVDLWKIRSNQKQFESDDYQMLHDGMSQLSQLPIFIEDSATLNILQIRSKARRLKSEYGLGLIIIDYLQLIVPRNNRSDNVVQQVSEISRNLKALAKEINIPVLALSQLSRAVEQRDDRRPRLSDLRESGSIEQDADVVMFIYRKDLEDIQTELMIAKHRNGPTGKIDLIFNHNTVLFRDAETNFTDYPEGEN